MVGQKRGSVDGVKPKVSLHIIMPKQISGPNTANRLIFNSRLKKKYDFAFVTQHQHAGGRINMKLIWDLKQQIISNDSDLLHFSGLQTSCFHAVIAARLAGKSNILVTIRGFSGDAIGISPAKRFVFNHIIEPITLGLSRRYIVVCNEALRNPIAVRYRKKCLGVVHNAAPSYRGEFDHCREAVRKELALEDGDVAVVVSGRVVYDKGFSFIAQAVKALKSSRVKIVILGDGDYLDEFKESCSAEIAEGRVICLGQRGDVMRILSGCDVFLFATLHENLSNALLEAMAMGLPVVATSVGGNLDVVEDGSNGFLIPPEDSDAIVRALDKLAGDKDLRKRFSKRSKEIVTGEYSQELLINRLDDIYEGMLGRK